MEMKGKNIFTKEEAQTLRELISLRVKTGPKEEQKKIRDKMRKIGFYGSDYGIRDCQLSDFEDLIRCGAIKIIGDNRGVKTVKSCSSQKEKAPDIIATDSEKKRIINRDETYVIDLCDEVLGIKSSRQHRFPFLLGDSGVPLPVDAYYEKLGLVVEYCEKQHTEAVKFFDRKQTVSGVSRGEQRRIYDERRKQVLPKHNIKLIIISYSDFQYDSQKRIVRNQQKDIEIVRKKLGL